MLIGTFSALILSAPCNQKHDLFQRRSRLSPWSSTRYPYWIIRQYDDTYIMSLIKCELSNTMLAVDDGSLPVTSDRFADWLLINIPFEIQTVQKILSFPSTIQRRKKLHFQTNVECCSSPSFQCVSFCPG